MKGKDSGLEQSFDKADDFVVVPVFGLASEKTPHQIQYLKLVASKIRDGAGGVVLCGMPFR